MLISQKRFKILFFLGIFISILIILFFFKDGQYFAYPEQATKHYGQIKGTVVDALSDEPIPQAKIQLKPLDIIIFSNQNGEFNLSSLEMENDSQSIDIIITKDGYGDFKITNDKLISGLYLNVEATLSQGNQAIEYDATPPKKSSMAEETYNLFNSPNEFKTFYNYYSNFSPPPYIDVAIRSGSPPGNTSNPIVRVDRVNFKTYCKSVLSHEWIDSWNLNSLKAGAMGVKTYGWYWVNKEPTKLSDVQSKGADVDNTVNYQVYIPTWYTNSGKAVDSTWGHIMKRSGLIFQSFYHAGSYNSDRHSDGNYMHQWGSKYWADNGKDWQWILNYYYDNIKISTPYSYFVSNLTKNYCGWNTPFIVQNLGSYNASVTVYFFTNTGRKHYETTYNNLPPKTSWSVNPSSVPALGSVFQGSAIVYSDRPIAVIVNEHSETSSMAYEGFPGGASKVYLPNITKNYFGWNTPFIIQNVDSVIAKVKIRFFNSVGKELTGAQLNETIKPGMSLGKNPTYMPLLGKVFQGSVVVESTNGKKIVASVNEQSKGASMSYNGFSNGAKKIYLPNVTKNYYGWTTPLIVQNIGSNKTSVTIQFFKPDGKEIKGAKQIVTINKGSSYGLNPTHISALGSKFQGSAVLTSSSEKIVAVCNEHSKTEAMAYSGVYSGKSTNYLPNITKNYLGWITPFIIQNMDTAQASVNINYYNLNGKLYYSIKGRKINPGSSLGINPSVLLPVTKPFKGSVVVTSTNGKKIVTIVNEQHKSGQAMAYNSK